MSIEVVIRLGFFFGILVLIALWELLSPRRPLSTTKSARWFSNLGVVSLNTVVVRLFLPIMPIGMAFLVQESDFGLLSSIDLSFWPSVIIGALLLDFTIYLQHIMFHAVPVLWRLHMVHHTDMDFDVTTGVRFHPIEIIISMFIKLAVIVVLSPPPLAVLLFEVLLNATAMFNHGNIYIPIGIDRIVRLIVITPDMHRVHHSVISSETNSKFGFNFPWWDRIFGTYRDQPASGHDEMIIGLTQFRDAKRLTLPWMLLLPFTGKTGDYPVNRR